jgi:hypothetical protein
VVRYAREYTGLAGAAHTLAATEVDIDAFAKQHLKNGFAWETVYCFPERAKCSTKGLSGPCRTGSGRAANRSTWTFCIPSSAHILSKESIIATGPQQ